MTKRTFIKLSGDSKATIIGGKIRNTDVDIDIDASSEVHLEGTDLEDDTLKVRFHPKNSG